MKYIKQFENKLYDEKCYWLLPTDDRFEESMRKIKCDDRTISDIKKTNDILKKPYIFIGYSPNGTFSSSNNESWDWNSFEDKMRDESFEEYGYSFKGTVNISDFELNSIKYNI